MQLKHLKWLCTVSFLLLTLSTHAQTWQTLGSAGFTSNKAYYTSLAFDSNDTAYIAFRDQANSSKATVMKYNGSSWVTVGSAGFSAGTANYVSLAIDGSGTPYVAYADNGNSQKATVMKYNGSSWVTVGSAGFSAGTIDYISLAIDGSGTPYVAYADNGNSQKATVMKYNGSSWVTVGSAGFTTSAIADPSLAIDDNDTVYVAFSDYANTQKATVMKYNGSSWVTVGSAGFSASGIQFGSLAIDNSGTLYVGYRDYSVYKATVMKYNGSSWATVGSVGLSAGDANYTSVAVDGSGTPYIAYADFGTGNGGRVTVMKYNGSSWVAVDSVGFSAGWAEYVSLAINSSGTPYVGYHDNGNSEKATVSVNGQDFVGWQDIGSAGFTSNKAYYTSLAFDSNDTAYIAFRDQANSNKATVMKYNGSSWVTVGSAGFSAGTASYVSLAIDGSGTPYVAYRDYANSSKATVMKYNGSSWVTVGSAGFSAGTIDYISLAIDGSGTPYAAYADNGNSQKATVMKYNGSSWVTVGSAGFTTSAIADPSLVIDDNDTVYVVFSDYANTQKATVMKYNGSSWVTVGSAGFSASGIQFGSLAIDNSGTLYVGYRDYSVYKATVMKYNGSSWATVGSVGLSAGDANYTSVAVDGSGTPYIAYADYGTGNGGRVTVMKYNGSSWVAVDSVGFSAGWAEYVSLAINSSGTPYVGYHDNGNSEKATVKAFPPYTWNGIWNYIGGPDSTDNVVINSNAEPASFSCASLFIKNGYALNTGTNKTVTIYGGLVNNGNGVTGQGILKFTKDGTAELNGDTIEHEGTIVVESGCTLNTNNKLRLTSDASNTGRIGESDGTINGDVMVQRYMPGKRCFRFYGHPFSSSIALSQLTDEIDITGSGGATNGFTSTTTNNPSAFWFDVTAADTSTSGANPGWTAFTSATTASWDQYELLRLFIRGAKGEGLTGGSYTPSAATFEGVGAVNQGTQVVTLTKGSNTTFVGCGNPFPSPVQMNTVARGSNIGANYYAWDATSGASGAYVTNAWTLDYKLPAYAAFFTTVSANSNNTLTFEEQDKESSGASLFKITGTNDWVELYIYDSTTKWDRLLINLNSNGMEVEDLLDGKKLYNPGLDFFTLSKDDVRLAVDVRPYSDKKSIPLGLTAYNRYNKYVIKTGVFNIPVGTKLVLHDKYLNKKEELQPGFEYWFDVTSDSLSQGNNRFEINMVGTPITNIITPSNTTPRIQLIPNPARSEVKVSFKAIEGTASIQLLSITGKLLYSQTTNSNTGSITIPLTGMPSGMYIVHIESENASYTEKLIKE